MTRKKVPLADQLISILGEHAALALMSERGFGGLEIEVPKGDLVRGAVQFDRIAAVIGNDPALKLCHHCGGTRLFVPKLAARQRAQRNRRIVDLYSDATAPWSINDLAREFGLTSRQIRTILGVTDMSAQSEPIPDCTQPSLF